MTLLNSSILTLALTFTAFASETKVAEKPMPSLLSFVEEKDAKGEIKKVYDEITKTWGFVPVVIKQYSLNPKLLRIQWELYKELGTNKNFDPKMLTMMRMLLGEAQACTYCLGLNKGMLLNMFKVPMDELIALSKDASTAKLDDKQKAMLLFILKAAKTPHETSSQDIQALKKLGWSDKDIFEGVKSGSNVIAATLLIDALKLQKDF
ncbi:MAG: Unknown protein [uncultured Sulfurovum sp.]|uniref:Carboxymuconolactone decarboxylase-like domain-containing protein n=1 Tax=uncultured Sulfurovum sp. TaxID=269237 RepID=A0A6S6TC15_9BACT|nr:MAG: Unknown protein [uncultured Sulfurovum sp.]